MDPTSLLLLLLTLTFLNPEWVEANSHHVDTSKSDDIPTPTLATAAESNHTLSQSSTLTDPNRIRSVPENVTFERLLQQLMVDAIKQEILVTLGLRQVPSATAARLNVSVQEHRQILRLYEKSLAEIPTMRQSTTNQQEEQMFRANQFHSFTEQGDRPSGLRGGPWIVPGRKRLFFPLDIHEDTNHTTTIRVNLAKLKLYKTNVRPHHLIHSDTIDNSVRIEVYQLLPGNHSTTTTNWTGGRGDGHGAGDPPLLRRTVASRLVSLTKPSFEEFDVSSAVQDWIRHPESNFGLEVACDSRYRLGDLMDFVVWSQSVRDSAHSLRYLPTLNVLTQERRNSNHHTRTVRSVTSSTASREEDCVQGSGEHRCCRYPLTVSFRDIGWESWIIHPREYQLYYCAGTCPPGFRVAHRFSTLKTLLSEVNPNLTLPVRCAPTRLLPLIVVHLGADGNTMTVSAIDNMIPEECMCA